jgi:hypothetical protein
MTSKELLLSVINQALAYETGCERLIIEELKDRSYLPAARDAYVKIIEIAQKDDLTTQDIDDVSSIMRSVFDVEHYHGYVFWWVCEVVDYWLIDHGGEKFIVSWMEYRDQREPIGPLVTRYREYCSSVVSG